MPSDDEVTAALRILTCAYDMHTPDDMRTLARAMLNAAEVIRLRNYEREIKRAFNPDHGGENGSI